MIDRAPRGRGSIPGRGAILTWIGVLFSTLALVSVSAEPPAASGELAVDPAREIERIAAAYADLDDYSLDLAFALFPDARAATASETARATIARRGRVVLSRIDAVETLLAEDVAVMVDHDAELLVIGPRPASAPAGGELDPASFASISGDATAPEIQELGRLRRLAYEPPHGEHRRVVIDYDRRTHRVERVVLLFRHPVALAAEAEPAAPRIEIRYRNLDVTPVLPPGTFSPARFFTRSAAGVAEPRSHLRSYRLIDHLEGMP